MEKGAKALCMSCGAEIEYNGFSWCHLRPNIPRHMAKPSQVLKPSPKAQEPHQPQVQSFQVPFEGEITKCLLCNRNVRFNGVLWTHYFEAKTQDSMSVRELLTGDVNRLRYITRHSTSLVLHRENVAEHSYYVALYSMFICEWVKRQVYTTGPLSDCPAKIDELEVLRRALIHDVDESRTGDFQRPFKHGNAKMKNMLDEAALVELATAVEGIIPSREFVTSLMALWTNAKSSDFEGRIVAFADYLSVVSYLCGEIGSANYSVMKDYRTMQDYTATFLHPSFNFLASLVQHTKEIVDEMIAKAGAY